ncbi:MAG: hypothetical protein AAB275_06310 [Deltaproteobacteria bacterium]
MGSEVALLRYLLLIALVYLAYRAIRHIGVRSVKTPDTDSTPVVAEMVKDPNCNTYIPLKSAIVARVRGRSYYFCSMKCEKEYKNK